MSLTTFTFSAFFGAMEGYCAVKLVNALGAARLPNADYIQNMSQQYPHVGNVALPLAAGSNTSAELWKAVAKYTILGVGTEYVRNIDDFTQDSDHAWDSVYGHVAGASFMVSALVTSPTISALGFAVGVGATSLFLIDQVQQFYNEPASQGEAQLGSYDMEMPNVEMASVHVDSFEMV